MKALRLAPDFELPLDIVTEATAIVATRGAGKSSASAVIVEEAFALGVQAVVFDRTGVYWGLRSSADGKSAGLPIYVLGGPHGDLPLESHAGTLIADLAVDSGHSFVLDLSDLSKSAAVKFAGDFLERIYDRKARSRSTTLLVIDEAHFYAPQTPRGGFKGDSAKLMGAMEDAVGLGRSRGLGVVLTTQRTQALNKAVLDLIETLLVMRMLSPRAREAVRGWVQEKHEEDDLGVIASLASLPTGTAWVWSPLRGILEKVALRRIVTFDSYKTPEPGQVAVEPTARQELDLGALGEEMRATAERAKENDPAELRKRLAATSRRVAELEAREPSQTVEEVVVEVPTFPEPLKASIREDYEGLASYLEGAKRHVDSMLERARDRLDADFDLSLAMTERRTERVRESPPIPKPSPVRVSQEVAASANGSLGTAARGFLETLARFYPMPLTLGQLGLLAGKKTRGGSFNTAMRQLRDGDYVRDDGNELRLTERGSEEAGVVPEPMTLERWRVVLPLAPREILDEVVASGGRTTVDEIAERTGRAPRGGSWNTALKMLTQSEAVRREGDVLVLAEEYR